MLIVVGRLPVESPSPLPEPEARAYRRMEYWVFVDLMSFQDVAVVLKGGMVSERAQGILCGTMLQARRTHIVVPAAEGFLYAPAQDYLSQICPDWNFGRGLYDRLVLAQGAVRSQKIHSSKGYAAT
jgi:hypothetical protein